MVHVVGVRGRMQSDVFQPAQSQRDYFEGRRVLVTGAAGRLGSELCRRLAALGCAHLALIDRFDHGLLEILESARRASAALDLTDALCDVRDDERVRYWLNQTKPSIVIHAAALNHAQLCERHVAECVLTNLVGARNVAKAAIDSGVSQFVLISSHRAAAPTCALGASRRLAELLMRGLQGESAFKTVMKSVRLGEVLRSQGSSPTPPRARYDAGEPLDITECEIPQPTRALHDAAELILQVIANESRSGTYAKDEPDQAVGKIHGVLRLAPKSASGQASLSDIAQMELIARTKDDASVRQLLLARLEDCLQRRAQNCGP